MNPKGNKRLDSLFVRRCHRQLLKAMVDEKQDVNRSKASNIFSAPDSLKKHQADFSQLNEYLRSTRWNR
jgi:hypothetical protein